MTIIELANQGLGAREIADRLGLSVWKTRKTINDLVAEGKLKHHADRKLASRVQEHGRGPFLAFIRNRHGLHVGRASDMVMSLTPEQLLWLGKTVPEGVTVAEFCCAVLRDLYEDEHDTVCGRVKQNQGYPAFTSCRGAGTRSPIA